MTVWLLAATICTASTCDHGYAVASYQTKQQCVAALKTYEGIHVDGIQHSCITLDRGTMQQLEIMLLLRKHHAS